ncbi:hypothetical protein OHB36_29005 [Streptomyces sp. NBC_00320]|uniref:hypothetical protein n=1 Tax=unclassified Streptomyces TaxID=2593676 RepID=UPI002259BF52|nr:hypothetical protein [Streptomyces sp. NBC_00320]MCX5150746.1 hypothetical protein [Streptomyces sp. NBC_00320]
MSARTGPVGVIGAGAVGQTVAALLTRGGRRLHLRISATWPWRHELATAFHRLASLPRPAG